VSDKKARDVMSTDCICVGENETLLDAARKLAELDVGSLPICGEDDRLKGMLTDRDEAPRAYEIFQKKQDGAFKVLLHP
jgi:CBS domain-containing protein